MDFGNLDDIPLADARAELRPVFDPRSRTYSVQLWQDGRPRGIHGLTDNFRHADEPLEAIDAFLAEHGVRPVTDKEAAQLMAGLVRASVVWTKLTLTPPRPEDDDYTSTLPFCADCGAAMAAPTSPGDTVPYFPDDIPPCEPGHAHEHITWRTIPDDLMGHPLTELPGEPVTVRPGHLPDDWPADGTVEEHHGQTVTVRLANGHKREVPATAVTPCRTGHIPG